MDNPLNSSTIASEVKRAQIIMIGILALVTMFFDFLQYFIGYRYVHRHYRLMRDKNIESKPYDSSLMQYKLRNILFWAKQYLLMGTLAWLTAIVLHSFLQ